MLYRKDRKPVPIQTQVVAPLTNEALAQRTKMITIEPHERWGGLAFYVMFSVSYDGMVARYQIRFWL